MSSFWGNLFDKVESMLLFLVFEHNDGRPKCTLYEALFFYQALTLHYEMILVRQIHLSDDESDECFTDFWGTNKNYMDKACRSLLYTVTDHLLELADKKGLERRPTQRTIYKALRWFVKHHSDVQYKCYNCDHVGLAKWGVKRKYKICTECEHWYIMPLENNVDYKEIITTTYIREFFEFCGIKDENAKDIMDVWKLRMQSMKIYNEANGDNVRFFSNHVVSSDDSQEYCFCLCLEKLEAGSVVKMLPCGHLMHSDCLREHFIHSDMRANDPEKGPLCWICRVPLMKVRRKPKKRKKRHSGALTLG